MLTMLAGALGGGLAVIGCLLFFGFVIIPVFAPVPVIGVPIALISLGSIVYVGAFCAVKASDWLGRFLDRND